MQGRLPTFATRPFTLFTFADTLLLHLVAVGTAGADAGAMVCHHVVTWGDKGMRAVSAVPAAVALTASPVLLQRGQ